MPARRRAELSVLILLVAAYLVLTLGNVRGSSATVDEYAHLPAACAALRLGELDLYGKNPPLVRYLQGMPAVALGARVPVPALPTGGGGWDPWRYGDAFVEANAGPSGLGRYPTLLGGARLAGLAMGLALGLLLYAWSRRLHGPAGGLASLFLLVLSPTFLAHSGLVTTDAGATLAIFAAAWLAWRALATPTPGRWALAGAGLGVAVASKFTALLLLPLLPLWWGWALVLRARTEPAPAAPRPRATAFHAMVFALSAFAVLHAAYRMQEPVRTLGSYHFFSRSGAAVADLLPAWTPVPLPGPMVRGIDAQALDLEGAEMPNYLRGRWSRRGWWYYYPLALLLKTPLALWGMVALAAGLALRRWRCRDAPPPPERRLAVGIASSTMAALLLASLTTSLDIGVRYLLPAFPFAYLLLGSLGARAARGGRRLRAAAAILALAYAGATMANHPHHIAFFNSLAGGRDGGWRFLLNSNNDWGQDLPRLARWLDEEGIQGPIYLAYFGHMDPARFGIDYVLAPDEPRPGVHVVSQNLLRGLPYVVVDHGTWRLLGDDLTRTQNRYAWLREREPVARIGGSLLAYRVGD